MLPIAFLGTTEILLIVFAILLLFGARKLPELARSMGSSVHEFKKGMNEGGKDAASNATSAPVKGEKSGDS
ncbi:MAG: twin-arginine translocase TatA/TatE family subunit [Planctomycetes bacterium]|nr:twin-arginine translocase TatA/TatE family subunit [Planctomycetota bacterium]